MKTVIKVSFILSYIMFFYFQKENTSVQVFLCFILQRFLSMNIVIRNDNKDDDYDDGAGDGDDCDAVPTSFVIISLQN